MKQGEKHIKIQGRRISARRNGKNNVLEVKIKIIELGNCKNATWPKKNK